MIILSENRLNTCGIRRCPLFFQRRNIALAIILSIVTCGIYQIYWLYKLAEDNNYIRNDPTATSPGLVVLLSIVTCGIYQLYWMYKAGETVDNIRVNQGMAPGSKAILYLLLTLFFPIVAFCLLQNDYNEMADSMNSYSDADTTRGYGQGYGQNYGQGYGQNYGQGYGQNYGQNYGQQYGQDQSQSYSQNYGQQPPMYDPNTSYGNAQHTHEPGIPVTQPPQSASVDSPYPPFGFGEPPAAPEPPKDPFGTDEDDGSAF